MKQAMMMGLGLLSLLGSQGARAQPAEEPAEQPDSYQDDQQQQRYMVDEQGRRLRVGFDPGSRWLLGAGSTLRWQHDCAAELAARCDLPFAPLGSFETSFDYRHFIDFVEDGVSWKLYHRALTSQVQVGPDGLEQLDITLYSGRFMRWSREGQLLWPANPPKIIPFPLNIGLDAAVGRVEYAELAAEDSYAVDLQVIRTQILLDFWRQRRLGSYAQLGVGPSYTISLVDRAAETALTVDHRVAPFTRGSFAFHHESADGHQVFDAQVEGGGVLSTTTGWSGLGGASLSYELVLLALNDLPLSAYTRADYRYQQAAGPHVSGHALSATTGLRLGVPLR